MRLNPVLLWSALAAVAAGFAAQPADAHPSELSGKQVVQKTCVTCHGEGLNGAPRIGDREAWNKRAEQGLTSLTQH
ncbi:MAG: hypothetical protein OEO84_08800, partial [Betaproteobacteria bacterium]|nr:hypothetical protein [Betaproteobacteria bacterium]